MRKIVLLFHAPRRQYPSHFPSPETASGTSFLFIFVLSTQGFCSCFTKCRPRWTAPSYRPGSSSYCLLCGIWHSYQLPLPGNSLFLQLSETALFPKPLPILWGSLEVFFSTINFKPWNLKHALCTINLQRFWWIKSASCPLVGWANQKGKASSLPHDSVRHWTPAPA